MMTVAVAACACDRAADNSTSMPGAALLQPTGLTEFNEQSWDALTGNRWNYLRRTSSKDGDIAADPAAPFSPERVLRIIFTPDMDRDSEPSVHWISLPQPREVHAAWWIKLSENWRPSPAGACKMTFLWTPDGHGQVYTALYGSGEPHRVGVNTQWAPYSQKIWDSNITTTPIYYGRWYRIDWHVRWATSADAANGTIRWWVDGVLNGNHVDVRFPGAEGFQQFEFAPTIQIPPPAEQHIYIDHSFVHGR